MGTGFWGKRQFSAKTRQPLLPIGLESLPSYPVCTPLRKWVSEYRGWINSPVRSSEGPNRQRFVRWMWLDWIPLLASPTIFTNRYKRMNRGIPSNCQRLLRNFITENGGETRQDKAILR